MCRSTFHIAKQYFTVEGNFTNPARDLFRWKRLWLYHNQSLFLAGAQGLVCIFADGKNRGSPPSSRRRQRSSALHLYYSSPVPCKRKTAIANAIAVFLAGAQGLEPWAYGFGDRRSTNWAIPLYIKGEGLNKLVGLQGFEPGTIRLWAGGSNQLS